MVEEIWKDVLDFEGIYQVSNLGGIRSLDRKVLRTDGKTLTYKGKLMNPSKNSKGYYLVDLRKNLERKTKRMHRLVAESFLGSSELEVNHKDGDKFNNSLENLEYMTHAENILHAHTVLKGRKRCGIYYHSQNNNWVARLMMKGKKVNLGSFECKEEAYLSYYNEYIKIHGVEPWNGELNEI